MQIQEELTLKSAALAKSSPTQWQDFLRAFKSIVEDQKEKLVNSPLEQLQVSQGRAHVLQATYKILEDCITNSEQMKRNKKP